MAIADRLIPKSPTSKPLRTNSQVSTLSLPLLATLATVSTCASVSTCRSTCKFSTTSSSPLSSAKSKKTTGGVNNNKRRRIAFSKNLTADKQLHMPRRAREWIYGGVPVQSARTGNPLLVINHFEAVAMAQQQQQQQQDQSALTPLWGGPNTEIIFSEVDPATKRVGKILAIVRRQGIRIVNYTYFPAFAAQPFSFIDHAFYQGKMFRQGELPDCKKRCCSARVVGLAPTSNKNGHNDFLVTPVLEAAPMTMIIRRAAGSGREWNLHMRDCQTKQSQILRESPTVEAVTIRSGQNMLVVTCLVYAA